MSVLDKILATKREEVAALKAAGYPKKDPTRGATRSLTQALRRKKGEPIRVLAEIKRASPSAGPIRPGADPAAIGKAYAAAGAAAVSVLTDKPFFDGDIAFLKQVRDAIELPILRKDFIIDPYQIVEAQRRGADALLLIKAALSTEELEQMLRECGNYGIEALVEVHTLEELEDVMSVTGRPTLIGVNHRDLATFEIDMTLTEQVALRVPADVVLVAESGIKTADDVAMLADAGAHAVLVGESLMRAPSPGDALKALWR